MRIDDLKRAAAAAIVAIAMAAASGCTDPPAPAAQAFHTVTSGRDETLLSAFIASDGTAYLAGGVVNGGAGVLLKWDGRDVTAIPTGGARAFWWIHGISDGQMWLAGESGEIHRFDGATLTRVEAGAPAAATLYGVWGPSGDDLWAVGGSFVAAGARQVIRRLSGGAWTAVAPPDGVDPDVVFFKVWGAATDDVWIVGDRGIVLRDRGAGLARADAPGAERYVTVDGCSSTDVYVVGGAGSGAAIHFDGAAFAPLPIGAAPPLPGVTCDGGVAWMGGMFGYVARVTPAAASAEVFTPPSEIADLGIHGLAARAGRVIAVGGNLVAVGTDPQHGFAIELRP